MQNYSAMPLGRRLLTYRYVMVPYLVYLSPFWPQRKYQYCYNWAKGNALLLVYLLQLKYTNFVMTEPIQTYWNWYNWANWNILILIQLSQLKYVDLGSIFYWANSNMLLVIFFELNHKYDIDNIEPYHIITRVLRTCANMATFCWLYWL